MIILEFALLFYGAGGHASNQLLLQEDENQHRRHTGNDGSAHQVIPLDSVSVRHGTDTERQRFLVVRPDQYGSKHVFVPILQESIYCRRHKTGDRQRQYYFEECLKRAAAVNARCLVQRGRDRFEVPIHHPGAEGDGEGRVHDHQAEGRIVHLPHTAHARRPVAHVAPV